MKVIGIILLVLEALAIFGSVVNGEFVSLFTPNSLPSLLELLGFLLPAIIGIILLRKAAKKNNAD